LAKEESDQEATAMKPDRPTKTLVPNRNKTTHYQDSPRQQRRESGTNTYPNSGSARDKIVITNVWPPESRYRAFKGSAPGDSGGGFLSACEALDQKPLVGGLLSMSPSSGQIR